MTIGSGQVSMLDVIQEHGGVASNSSLTQYYKGGATHYVHPSNPFGIPSSGGIALSQFRGSYRMGYYNMVGTYFASANGAQYGWNVTGQMGQIQYNNRYRGYTLYYFIWNAYDGQLGICINAANVPVGTVSNIWLPTHGWVRNYGGFTYNGNFFGLSLWLVTIGTGTNPFNGGWQEFQIV